MSVCLCSVRLIQAAYVLQYHAVTSAVAHAQDITKNSAHSVICMNITFNKYKCLCMYMNAEGRTHRDSLISLGTDLNYLHMSKAGLSIPISSSYLSIRELLLLLLLLLLLPGCVGCAAAGL